VRGLANWIAQYGLNLTQNQIRKSDPVELADQIVEAAQQKIAEADLSALAQYTDPLFAKARLVRWAREKFGIDVPLDEIASANRDDAERTFREHMRSAYRQREIEYPVGAVIEYALQRGGSNANEVCSRIAIWANRKYNKDWTYEHFVNKSPEQIYRELREVNADYLSNGRLDAEIEAAVREHDTTDLEGQAHLENWARDRFGAVLEVHPLDFDDDLRPQLQQCGYEMLRYELTQLERYVFLTTLDAVWKDHMYAMDLLRHSIGLRGYAEQDPKIAYKREGTRMFNEMLENVRERVTDLIFKVRIAAPAGADAAEAEPSASPLQNMRAQHADATNVGFSGASEDQEAAMRKQGEGGAAQTIRREAPKVGRNDPCPCGSGKKYKQCCGKAR
jgi:preprotein translocase subunit SecA